MLVAGAFVWGMSPSVPYGRYLTGSSAVPGVPVPYGRLCLSSAVDIKTATCNIACNMPKGQCPAACMCSSTMHRPTTNLSLAMPPDEYARLVEGLDSDESDESSLQAVISSLALKSPPTFEERPSSLSELPREMVGYYSKTWDCKMNASSLPCAGPNPNKNINVVFSGFSTIKKALAEALDKGSGGCANKDMAYCDKMAEYMVSTTGEFQSLAEAKAKMVDPDFENKAGVATAQYCKKCYEPEKGQAEKPHPFSQKAGMYQGVQFLSLGGASDDGVMTTLKMADFWGEGYAKVGIEAIKDAGFQGVCFDIE